MKLTTTLLMLAVSTSAHGFDVRGIEPGKTTFQEARRIVEQIAAGRDHAPFPWEKMGVVGGCSTGHVPTGSPLKGWKYCAWSPFQYMNKYGELSSTTFGAFSLAGVTGHPSWTMDNKSVLQGFEFIFDAKAFERIRDAAVAKWGKPTKHENANLQNRFGARFENEAFGWEDGTGVVWLYRYARDNKGDYRLDLSRLMMKSRQFIDGEAKSRALMKTEKRKDF